MSTDQTAADAYLDALGAGDRSRAFDVVRACRQDGMSVLEILAEVVAPAQYRIGELWAADEWSVAQEHAATAVSEAVVAVLGEQVSIATASAAPVVVSCVELEFHALPALLVSEHLREAGLPVSYLGANASAEALVRHVHETGPRAVALSCSLGGSLVRVRRQIEAVRETGTPVIVGGAAFDAEGQRAAALGATGYAATGAEAVDLLRRIPRAVSPAEPLGHPGVSEARLIYSERELFAAEIGARLRDTQPALAVAADSGWGKVLADHLPLVVGSVAGALITQDPRVLHEGLAWAGHVLDSRGAPAGLAGELRDQLAQQLRELPVASDLLAGVGRPA